MQKYRQAAASIAILTIMLSAGLYTNYNSNKKNGSNKKSPAKQEEILATFENHDYDAWKMIMTENVKNSDFTRSDFETFIQARQAARSGNYDQAITISQNLVGRLKDIRI